MNQILNQIFPYLLVSSLLFFMGCASKPIDLQSQNPKLFKELIRTYHIPSELKQGEVEPMEFNLKEPRTIAGKISNFPIDTCTWFFDRKLKTKGSEDSSAFPSKKINLNCNDRFYILDLNERPDLVSKISYEGNYKDVVPKLKKGIILEAGCSIASVTKDGLEESSLDKKNATVECYPYPHDINQYVKEQNREIIVGHFLYVDKPESLKDILDSSADNKDNDRIFQAITIEFASEEKRKYQSLSSLIGKDFEFSNCEFIDFREIPAPNSKGQELKTKIEELMNTDLQVISNKEKLKDAIDEYMNCGSRCISKEKDTYAVFEVRNNLDNKIVILILRLKSKAELGNFKRFQNFKVSGILSQIDFSDKGVIEKINLDMIPKKDK